ncbi:hypothetical protein ACFV3E_24605 [Streptomyces sp. NPDC059718]
MSGIPEEHTFFWVIVSVGVPAYMFYVGGAWADAGIWVLGAVVVGWIAYFSRPT